jgi:hypothetical protein
MKKNRLYFRQDDEMCYTIKAHLQYMIENEIDAMYIFPAKLITGGDYFWCKEFQAIGDKPVAGFTSCGKLCSKYKPRNGKSGVCTHWGYTYDKTDKCYTLKIDSII